MERVEELRSLILGRDAWREVVKNCCGSPIWHPTKVNKFSAGFTTATHPRYVILLFTPPYRPMKINRIPEC